MSMAGSASLGNNYEISHPPHGTERVSDAFISRYKQQELSGKLLPKERVAGCMHHFMTGRGSVDILYSERVQKAHYGGLMVCGSVWVCPVCSAKITERRRVELSEAIQSSRWRYTPILITLTFQHTRDDELKALLAILNDTFRELKKGAPWDRAKARYGIEHYVTSLEVTWGGNGWHPHKHMLVFSSLPEDEIDTEGLEAWLSSRWQALLSKKGYYSSELYGVKVQAGNDKVGDYVSKWGIEHELTKAPVKRGRVGRDGKGLSPFELLELYGLGEKWAGELFKEYAAAMKGRHQLQWSRGARSALGLSEVQKTDEELAIEQEEEAVVMASLDWSQWKLILKAEKRGEVLQVASSGDVASLWKYLTSLGVYHRQEVGRDYPNLELENP